MIFQFLLPGAASIYYGDEARIRGTLGTNEGCRYPMPWEENIASCEAYQLVQMLAKAKASHKALSSGSMKFLYAEGNVVAIARFCQDEVFVGIISTGDHDETIRLPLGIVGASGIKRELFDRNPIWNTLDENSIELTVKAHQSYFMECTMKDKEGTHA